jgi:hypothetical protein
MAGRPKPIQAAFEAKQARAKVFRAIRADTRSHTDVHFGQFVKFFRNRQGWGSEPCQDVSVSGNIATSSHKNIHETAARSSIIPRDPPFSVFLNPRSEK